MNDKTKLTNKTKLTIESLYTEFLPYLPHSALKLYIYYRLSSQKQQLNLMKFHKETNTSINSAYRALKILKEKELIPQNTTFINTYEPE